MTDWVNTTCPCCGGPAKRETDTMPQWAGSSWYFLRYMDPHNDKVLASKEALDYWSPVDWYNGGMEHTTLHLLYSRFWHKFLYDIGVVPTKEPYQKRTSHGMILGEGGEKMSKSRGNVINPNDIIAQYGADTMRTYIMFIGDFEKAAAWSAKCGEGLQAVPGPGVEPGRDGPRWGGLLPGQRGRRPQSHQEGQRGHRGHEVQPPPSPPSWRWSTTTTPTAPAVGDMKALILMLAPFAPPHLRGDVGDDGLCRRDREDGLPDGPWPVYDESKTVAASVEMAVQVQGKLRGTVVVPMDSDQDDVIAAAKSNREGGPVPGWHGHRKGYSCAQ